MIQIILAIFGIIALVKGEFKITSNRKVSGSVGKALGVLMLLGAALPFVAVSQTVIPLGTLVLVIIIGWATSEKIGPPDVGKLKVKGDVKGLIKALSYEKDTTVRQLVAEALGEIGDKKAVEPLRAAFNDQENVRIAALKALGQIGDAQVVNFLVAAANWKDEATSAAGLQALHQLGDVGVDILIEDLKTSREPAGLVVTAKTLGILRNQRAFDSLVAKLKDEEADSWVRGVCAEALGQLGDSRVFTPLLETLQDTSVDEEVRGAAAKALGQHGDQRAVEPLLAVFREEGSLELWELWEGAAQALGQLGDSRAIGPLLEALKIIDEADEEDAVGFGADSFQSTIVKALEYFRDVSVIESLIKILENDKFYTSPVIAESLQKMTGQDFETDPTRWREWWKKQQEVPNYEQQSY